MLTEQPRTAPKTNQPSSTKHSITRLRVAIVNSLFLWQVHCTTHHMMPIEDQATVDLAQNYAVFVT